jgi:hypothetical protein
MDSCLRCFCCFPCTLFICVKQSLEGLQKTVDKNVRQVYVVNITSDYKHHRAIISYMLHITNQYFDMINTHLNNLSDNFAIHQALANPRKSQELTEFVQDLIHHETSSLMREHNDIIQTQHNRITFQDTQIERLQCERVNAINSHATEIQSIHGAHTAEIKSLHCSHAAEIQGLHMEYCEKIKNALPGV